MILSLSTQDYSKNIHEEKYHLYLWSVTRLTLYVSERKQSILEKINRMRVVACSCSYFGQQVFHINIFPQCMSTTQKQRHQMCSLFGRSEWKYSTKLWFCSSCPVFLAPLASMKAVIFIKRLIQIFGSDYMIPRATQSQTDN